MRSAGGGPLVAADFGVSGPRRIGVSAFRVLGVSAFHPVRRRPRELPAARDYRSLTFRPTGSPNDAAPVAGSRS